MANQTSRPGAATRGDDFDAYHNACHEAAADAVAEDLGVTVPTALDLYRDRVVAVRESMLRVGGYRSGAETGA